MYVSDYGIYGQSFTIKGLRTAIGRFRTAIGRLGLVSGFPLNPKGERKRTPPDAGIVEGNYGPTGRLWRDGTMIHDASHWSRDRSAL